jgi:ubiquinone biosynthesis O-methyltransferase
MHLQNGTTLVRCALFGQSKIIFDNRTAQLTLQKFDSHEESSPADFIHFTTRNPRLPQAPLLPTLYRGSHVSAGNVVQVMSRLEDRSSNGQGAKKSVAVLYGLSCHTLFVLGVGAMIFGMFFGMSRSLGRLQPPLAYAADALLLVQFPLVHSYLLSQSGRRALARLAPRSMGRDLSSTTYAAIASAQVALLFLCWSPSRIIWWSANGWSLILTTTLYAASWCLLLKSIMDAGVAYQIGLLGWWAIFRGIPVCFPSMPRDGLFKIVRQPIYVSFALTVWTAPTWTPDQLAVAIVMTSYCLVGPLFKERRFTNRFGPEFAAYQKIVPYWLPGPRRPRGRAAEHARALNDQTLYEKYAADWWTGRWRWLRTLQNLVPVRMHVFDPHVGDWAGCDLLDLGCGGGFFSEALARRGATVVGVDPSQAAIDAARMHCSETDLQIDYRTGVGERIPAIDQSFDIVVCVDVLEHVTDLPKVISEVRRVLRPGGLLLFDTINRTWIAAFIIVTLGESVFRLLPRGAHDPSLFIPPLELLALLETNAIEMLSIEGLGPRGVNRRLDPTFGPYDSLAVMYIGAARAGRDAAYKRSPSPASNYRSDRTL